MDNLKNRNRNNDDNNLHKSGLINNAANELEFGEEFDRNLECGKEFKNQGYEHGREFNEYDEKNNLEFGKEFKNPQSEHERESNKRNEKSNIEYGKDYISTNTNPNRSNKNRSTGNYTNTSNTVEFAKEPTTKSTTKTTKPNQKSTKTK